MIRYTTTFYVFLTHLAPELPPKGRESHSSVADALAGLYLFNC